MAALVDRFDGTLDKFVGDEVVVFFGDPVTQEDHALRAVRMAQAMRARLGELEREWEERGVAPFRVRMGIATGFVTVGNFGSERFTDYTVIGRTVNLASRIMNEAPVGGLWVNSRTYHLVKHAVDADALGERTFRGISDPQELFAVR